MLNVDHAPEWCTHQDWLREESILSFGGQPLVYQGEVLGVLAIFSRSHQMEEEIIWLRMIADHAAVTVSNARAFTEIEHLKRHLELENEYLKSKGKLPVIGKIRPLSGG